MNDWSKSNDSLSPQLNRHSRIVTRRDSSDLSEFSLDLEDDPPPDKGTSQTGSRLNNQSYHHFDVIALHPNNEDNPNDVSSSELSLDLANVHHPDQATNQTGSRLNNQRDHDLENTQVDPGNNNEDRVYEDMTFEQVEDTDLTPEESFIFMLGMLNRIEKYSETLNDGVHGKWYKNNIAMVKTVLIKSYSLFKSENLTRHNGSLYINNKPSQTQVHKDNNGSELKKLKKRGVKAKKKVVFRGKKDNQYSNTQAELNIDDQGNIETLEERFSLDKSELRRSQCLQIKDKKDVFCDKIKKKSQHSNTQVEVNVDYEENTEIPEKIFSLDKLETRRSQRLPIKDKKDVFCDKIKKKSQHSNTQVEVNIDYEENTEIPEKIFSLDKLETRRSQRLQIKDKEALKSDNIKKHNGSLEVELSTDDQENTKPPEKSLGKSEPRRSQRLQIEDREVVFCDRLEYVHLKLAAATSTPLPERLNKSLSAKQQTVKRKSRSSCGIPSKRGRNSGKASLNSTVPTSSQENVTLGTVVNKSRQSSRACKRLSKNPSRKRAKSLDLKSKKGKGGSGTKDAMQDQAPEHCGERFFKDAISSEAAPHRGERVRIAPGPTTALDVCTTTQRAGSHGMQKIEKHDTIRWGSSNQTISMGFRSGRCVSLRGSIVGP
ncbi:hypothetical protein MTP99_000805 [Tenebrio molitor]|nr:hypothetical protein MTP99_000805 [Tenebrio molitor]